MSFASILHVTQPLPMSNCRNTTDTGGQRDSTNHCRRPATLRHVHRPNRCRFRRCSRAPRPAPKPCRRRCCCPSRYCQCCPSRCGRRRRSKRHCCCCHCQSRRRRRCCRHRGGRDFRLRPAAAAAAAHSNWSVRRTTAAVPQHPRADRAAPRTAPRSRHRTDRRRR